MSAAKPGVDPKLLELLVCPLTKGVLRYDAKRDELPIPSGTGFRSCWSTRPVVLMRIR
jgi:hypothetical protein